MKKHYTMQTVEEVVKLFIPAREYNDDFPCATEHVVSVDLELDKVTITPMTTDTEHFDEFLVGENVSAKELIKKVFELRGIGLSI